MSDIVFENVSKWYDTELAIDNLTLSFEKNLTTAVVGRSGSGKSTLLQLINGLIVPNRGGVVVYGEPIDYRRLSRLRVRIGYAVQGTGLFPHLSVFDNIALLANLAKWNGERIRDRAFELMRLAGLPVAYADRFPHELSGGQQQRVGLCRAMMLDPKIFLLDEPFGALDPITRNEIHEEFIHLQRYEPRTIVLVTHDLREALKLAQRIVILNQGHVEQSASADEMLQQPSNDFVAGFFRSQLET